MSDLSQPIFSIIVPVYNVGDYVEKCLNSIANQTFKSYEVIIVNDGSTDNSLVICERFCDEYKNFFVFNKLNEGQGVARNFGLQRARGDYICYVDSDDWIEPSLCEECFRIFESHKIDFINFGIDFISSSGKVVKKINKFSFNKIVGDDIFARAMIDDQILSSSVNKAYSRLFLLQNKINFPKLRSNEDIYYSRLVAKNAQNTIFINKVLYHAAIRENSTTRNMSCENLISAANLLELEKELIPGFMNHEKLASLYKAHAIKLLSGLLIQAAFRVKGREEYLNCFKIASNCSFYRYSLSLSVLSNLKIKNLLMIFICFSPRLTRFGSKLLKLGGLKPY